MPVAYVGYNGNATFGAGVQWVNQLLPDAFPGAPAVAIGTPADLGLIDAASVTSLALTTGANSALGNFLIAFGGSLILSTGMSSVTDSASNSYTMLSDGAATSVSYGFKSNAAALGSGGTITGNFAGAVNPHGLCAASVSGISTAADPRDVAPAAGGGAGLTTVSINSGILAQANEILFGIIGFDGTPGTFTPGTGWTLFKAEDTNVFFRIVYQIASSTPSKNWAPSWVTPRTCKARLFSLKGQ